VGLLLLKRLLTLELVRLVIEAQQLIRLGLGDTFLALGDLVLGNLIVEVGFVLRPLAVEDLDL
jgi:hypothetical protein